MNGMNLFPMARTNILLKLCFVSVISVILMTFANNLLNRFMTELLELEQSTDHSKMLSPTKLQKMKWF